MSSILPAAGLQCNEAARQTIRDCDLRAATLQWLADRVLLKII
jgi:hypothetical protein